jgi:cytochrome c oxidase assembly protein subunit 15
LLAIGSIVTTFRAGMEDPIWPTYPWHLLLISWEEPRSGFIIEHSHRAAGYFVGLCAIVLAFGLWRYQRDRWLRWLGITALGAVIVQGLLGGFRVLLDRLLGPNLALIHGSFAQLVFALLLSLALFTSSDWRAPADATSVAATAKVRHWSILTACLVFLQIIFGGFLRHTYSPLGQRGHLMVAFAVVAVVVWLLRIVVDQHALDRKLLRATVLLAVLVAFQVLLGVEAWLSRYLLAMSPGRQAIIRTAHFLVGSGVFATAVVVALRAHRQLLLQFQFARAPIGHLEEAA